MYKDTFFTPDYLVENPDQKALVTKLQERMNEQIDIVEKGLAIHSRLCPEEMHALQEQLESVFAKMKAEVKG